MDLRRYGSRSEALERLGLGGFVSAAVRGYQSTALRRERDQEWQRFWKPRPAHRRRRAELQGPRLRTPATE